jgi:hypothetical protein
MMLRRRLPELWCTRLACAVSYFVSQARRLHHESFPGTPSLFRCCDISDANMSESEVPGENWATSALRSVQALLVELLARSSAWMEWTEERTGGGVRATAHGWGFSQVSRTVGFDVAVVESQAMAPLLTQKSGGPTGP